MINKNIKIIVAAILFATAIWQFTEKNIGNGIFLILLTALVALVYFKNEMLIMTLFKFRKQDMEGAKRILAKINPNTALIKNQQGYYFYLNGIINAQNNLNQAEKDFRKAVELGLNQKEDLAVAKLQLAGIAMGKNRPAEAQKLLAEAKQHDAKGMLKEQINMVEAQMKQNRGQKVPMWYNQNKKRGF
ncbi:DUF2892 domain-containing protein [Myroides sp. JBRI-B21084]|uniref:DUF2892 domain-containing protein n=1 Tax=Myroides sp. JBRI-B21084 TaxID=3119977 RepID=UPI0026E1CEBB|nr:DUF2892 domain-containing protein [Paenimyroides cloacae]WKW47584.1 DUF2892 domain-containing protein [Paenimyroides cloacae]